MKELIIIMASTGFICFVAGNLWGYYRGAKWATKMGMQKLDEYHQHVLRGLRK